MCGIAGFWQVKRRAAVPAETLTQMGSAIRHRGPDDSGTFYDSASGIGLVHRRLSIIDLSSAGHQPMASHSGRYTIIFNGEVYNFEEIRAELGTSSWRGHSDTEVMLEAIDRWGLTASVKRFVGMFAFALLDRAEQKLYLVRDRLGIKPLYYGWVNGDFVFASELKALHQYPGFEGSIDRNALALYLRHNYVPSPHCIYQGLHKLKAGCILELKSANSQPAPYHFWSAEDVARRGVQSRVSGEDQDVIKELWTQLQRAVSLRMIADVPLGTFLSGGVDSSTVAALMQSQSTRAVQTFTIGFHEDDHNEATHAKRIAAHLGTDHTELYLTPKDALDVVPQLPSMFDEPFADSSQIPTFLVSKLARQNVTVSLSGDGGDELFGGYNRYLFTKRMWRVMKQVPISARKAVENCILSVRPEKIDDLNRRLNSLVGRRNHVSALGDKAHKFANFLELPSAQSLYMRALSHWDQPDILVPGSREPKTVADFIARAASLPSLEEAMMLTDLANYLPDDILTKVDRASMAVGLEARVPLLDHNIVEFAWKLPLRFKIRNGVGKWILRQVLYKYVPAELVERPKMGFGVPIAAWLRGPLHEWAQDLLSPAALKTHGLFDIEIIRQRWQEHLSGKRNWQYHLWDILVFQDWMFHQVGARQLA